jgi:CspA family cold shock protein
MLQIMQNSLFCISLHIINKLLPIITMEGTVKFFNEAKGFGFVKEAETEKEYFVHVSGLVDQIRENDKITFELKEGKKGLNAVNVRVAR